MTILAIDPGCDETAFVLLVDGRIRRKGKVANPAMLDIVRDIAMDFAPDACVIEMVACYGMAVGREVFETVYWIGRFAERYESLTRRPARRIFRQDIKLHLCHSNKASDSNIRRALIDRYGPGKELAIGRKAVPGPLYGVKKDIWAALAIACTYQDKYTPARTPAAATLF